MTAWEREQYHKRLNDIVEAYLHNEDMALEMFIGASDKAYQNGLVDGRINGLREAQEALERMITGGS